MDFDFGQKRESNIWMILMAILVIGMAIALSGYIFKWNEIFKQGFPGSSCKQKEDCLDGLTCKTDNTCGC